jgi:hypothetical protein
MVDVVEMVVRVDFPAASTCVVSKGQTVVVVYAVVVKMSQSGVIYFDMVLSFVLGGQYVSTGPRGDDCVRPTVELWVAYDNADVFEPLEWPWESVNAMPDEFVLRYDVVDELVKEAVEEDDEADELVAFDVTFDTARNRAYKSMLSNPVSVVLDKIGLNMPGLTRKYGAPEGSMPCT